MNTIESTEVRRNFVDVASRVRDGHERLIVRRNGRPLVALVPVEDVARLEAMSVAPGAPAHIDRAAVAEIVKRVAGRRRQDSRSAEDIVGYDERGLPQ